jgi:hypothetical protein
MKWKLSSELVEVIVYGADVGSVTVAVELD